MNLSNRLKTVAAFVPEGSRVADIGTDHGYVPIYLVKEGNVKTALAMDIRSGPLERAAKHIRDFGLEDQITVRQSDGLKELKVGEADTVVIAGMGGELMIRILTEGSHVWSSVKKWILSPQSELHKVRAFLRENGFSIEKEAMVLEDGKYYTVMAVNGWKKIPDRAYVGQENMDIEDRPKETVCEKKSYDYYGKYLIQTKDSVLADYLTRERKQKEELLKRLDPGSRITERSAARIRELQQELIWIKEAQDEMQ